MTPLVVLTGNSRWKTERLKRLYEQYKPCEQHDLIVVFNGDEAYDGADIYPRNDPTSRDIGMCYEAVRQVERPFYFFMNDDVVHIKGAEWLRYALERSQADIVGVQTNLSSIVPLELIEALAGKGFPSLRWGTRVSFIRTSAFACSREFFLRLWEASGGDADYFEKHTIIRSKSYDIFEDPFYIFDTNLQPFYRFTELPRILKRPYIWHRKLLRYARWLRGRTMEHDFPPTRGIH